MVLTRRQQASQEKPETNGSSTQSHHPPPKTLQHQAQEVAAHIKQEQSMKGEQPKTPPKTPAWVYLLLVLFAIITNATIPEPFHPPHGQEPTITHVFYYGWLTAISTGLGALPFLLVPDVESFWVGISNGTSWNEGNAMVRFVAAKISWLVFG